MAADTLSSLAVAATVFLCFISSIDGAEVRRFQCNDGGVVNVPSGKRAMLKRARKGELCILARMSLNRETNKKTFVPAARSYDKYEWENIQGEYSHQLSFSCSKFDCVSKIPSVNNPMDDNFLLISFQRDEISDENKISRFLEQATFGATASMLSNWNYSEIEASFAHWIKEQTEDIPASQHRAYFRSRSFPRYISKVPIGRPKNPCEMESRWRTYAFTIDDLHTKKILEVKRVDETALSGGPYRLLVDGETRTIMNQIEVETEGQLNPGSYPFCSIHDGVGSGVSVQVNRECQSILGGNPKVSFPLSTRPSSFISFPPGATLSSVGNGLPQGSEIALGEDILGIPACEAVPVGGSSSILYGIDDTVTWYIFDPRLTLAQNTMEDPLPDGGGKTAKLADISCANVPRTFLNEETCKLSHDLSSCGSFDISSASVAMNRESLQTLSASSDRQVYAVKDLAATSSPCTEGPVRWLIVSESEENCKTTIQNTKMVTTLSGLIEAQEEANQNGEILELFMPDVSQDSTLFCDASDEQAIGTKIFVGNTCYKHVHKDYYNVYDFSLWSEHVEDGVNVESPIQNWNEPDEVVITFATLNDAGLNWEVNKTILGPPIAKFGDEISFADLPESLRVKNVAQQLDATSQSADGPGIMVCGSPGEVANGHSHLDGRDFDALLFDGVDEQFGTEAQRQTVWMLNILQAEDQLRQRVAHALSLLLIVNSEGVASKYETEPIINYYDIFTRNAFGNYRDVLKEVSHSPMMGEMLSHLDSRSTIYVREKFGIPDSYPDENFAREIMQLFTIGTVKLRQDGTPIKGKNTYDGEDVMDGARAWTAFRRQLYRGNIEDERATRNRIDPMDTYPEWRDPFPKMLFKSYVGDRYPLCVDLPNRAFLRTGATFRLLGSSPHAELQYKDKNFEYTETVARIVLDADNSQLYERLCNEDNGKCNFRNEVVLEQNLECHGMECDVQTVRVVQVGLMFYEYKRPACVEMSFYTGKKVQRNKDGLVHCAHQRLPVATEACCPPGKDVAERTTETCKYFGERLTYQAASQRCVAIGGSTCDWIAVKELDCGECCTFMSHRWTDSTCGVQVKVKSDGKVAFVHSLEDRYGVPVLETRPFPSVARNTNEFFRVLWLSGDYSALVENCVAFKGDDFEQGSCLYETEVVEEPVFKSRPSSSHDVRQHCQIGAYDLSMFEDGKYAMVDTVTKEDVKTVVVWAKVDGEPYDVDTVFQIKVRGEDVFLKNIRSTVKVLADSNDNFAFRNTPQFMNMHEPTSRDAQYETEAVIDAYFHHRNMAPLLAKHMIQRFGVSNPSSRYMRNVVDAFKTGVFVWEDISGNAGGDISFGTGKYGDLKALISAILLDREARTPVLDMDPSFGSIREPLVKVAQFMRAMEFVPDKDFRVKDMAARMGQMAYDSPDVFGFFASDFSPPGPLADASLACPEAMTSSSPQMLGLVSGLFSMIKYGFTYCDGGFGPLLSGRCRDITEGDHSTALGRLTYVPESFDSVTVISKLNTLLMAGRMSKESLQIVTDAYEGRTDGTNMEDNMAALRIAQQLVVSSPEFHATNLIERDNERTREGLPEVEPSSKPYKAVVYLFLYGGCDTYNLLVPHPECSVYTTYKKARSNIALEPEELNPIDATSSGQVCDKFGIHHKLPILQELYDSSEALFFANVGVLPEPNVTRENYKSAYDGLVGLFGHNTQRKEIQEMDPWSEQRNTGVLGRMADALTSVGYKTGSTSVADSTQALTGTDGKSPVADVVNPIAGVELFNPNPSSDAILPGVRQLNNATTMTSGFFAETWARKFSQSLDQNLRLSTVFDGVEEPQGFDTTVAGRQFRTVAKMMKTRNARGVDRDVFFVNVPGFDTHAFQAEKLNEEFSELNDALRTFKAEMEAQGLWDDVVIYATSEFGRTLVPNSNYGTDHALAGHNFMLGGSVKGGQIKGKYPLDYDDIMLDRGRLIPTLSHEQCLHGLADWFGVESGDMDYVLPNVGAFPNVFSANDLFVS